jgi:nucleoside-diphosphate-sugar epimerase
MFRYADIGHSQRVLGYKPTTSIETGLKKFAEWYLADERTGQIEGFANDGQWNAK